MIVGREDIKNQLTQKVASKQPELIAILGRRRVGKTFTVRNFLAKDMVFQFTGLYQGILSEHLSRFHTSLVNQSKYKLNKPIPTSWFEAFDLLITYLEKLKSSKKKVVFLDEFPWMATNKSRFLTAFTDFWNSYGSTRNDLMVIICGSSASWMINKVLRNKGGLHNRVTGRIDIKPFTLKETKAFLQSKNIIISDIDIIKLYMMMGGIPFYLEQLQKGESLVQGIDRICFSQTGLLRTEYGELLASLFNESEKHTQIIETLYKRPQGMLREEVIKKSGLTSGGGTTTILEELEASDFITSFVPYGNKAKDRIYKLKDYYIRFYLKYIKPSKPSKSKVWEKISNSSSYISWSGLSYENICLDHIDEIKQALKIDGIHSEAGGWHARGNDDFSGAQIDLLLDRADNVINICEIKFYNSEFLITSDYAKKLRNKITAFQVLTKTRKALFPTMITTYGLIENKHSTGLVQQSITMDSFF